MENFCGILYSGFAAGTYYGNTGGGVNYQCLPLSPDHDSYATSGSVSIISGVEYESSLNGGAFTSGALNQNVPCARCLTQRTAVMMYPAKTRCPTGWNEEYEG